MGAWTFRPIADPFGHTAKVCRIDKYGASKTDAQKTREAFTRAFADCTPGGTVEVPWGTWVTGGITIPSDVTLKMDFGSTLSFSDEPDFYLPAVATRWEGMDVMNYQPLVYAPNAKNVAIIGHGSFLGNGTRWWEWKEKSSGRKEKKAAGALYEMTEDAVPLEERIFGSEDVPLRPAFVQFYNADTVVVDGPKFFDGPMWTLHFVYSKNITVRNVTVDTVGPNTDGIAFDSSENGLVEHAKIGSGDDAIVIKSGLDYDGWKQNKPSKHIAIRNVTVFRGNGGVTIGSELSGGIEDVSVQNSTFKNLDTGIRLKTLKGRGGYVRNIRYENIDMRNVDESAMQFDLNYEYATLKSSGNDLTEVRDVSLRDIRVRSSNTAFRIGGSQEAPMHNFSLENSSFFVRKTGKANDIAGGVFRNVFVFPMDGKPIEMKNVQDVRLEGYFPRGNKEEAFAKCIGPGISNILVDLTPCPGNRCVTRDDGVPKKAIFFK